MPFYIKFNLPLKSNFGASVEKITVCVLTFNSDRLLEACLSALSRVADEMIVVDSGSTDKSLEIIKKFDCQCVYRRYSTHAEQMNFAVDLASNNWVLCMDSDEILDAETIHSINALKNDLADPSQAYRLQRHWYVLGEEVHAIYPVSSPDYPVRLFNKSMVSFNDAPVDDKPIGFSSTKKIAGHVRHDTFYSIHEVFQKLNTYTTRLVSYKPIEPSLARAFSSAAAAFIKWYFLKKSWRNGKVGFVAGIYAGAYSFLKYFKAWYLNKN